MILRPNSSSRKENSPDKDPVTFQENHIINLDKMSKLFQAFLDEHNFGKCKTPQINMQIKNRFSNLGTSASIKCLRCDFESCLVNLYDEGPNNKCLLNSALAIPMMKTKMGPSDIQFLLASLNIKPPSLTTLHAELSEASEIAKDENKKTMIENQHYVRRVQELKGQANKVDVETDTSYNKRQQSGIEAGTMSITPMTECSTNRKLVLALNVCNKKCTKRGNCDHQACSKNYATDRSISSSEAYSTKINLENIQSQEILSVRSVTSDQSNQVEKIVREFSSSVIHYQCLVHRLRNLQKRIQNLKLVSFIDHLDNETFSRHVARSIRSRLYFEIIRWNKTSSTQSQFLHRIKQACYNIMPCFTGDHKLCSKVSVFCRSRTKQKVKRSLPKNEYLVLTPNDTEKLSAELNKFAEDSSLNKIKAVTHTNKVESVHHRCFTVAPKNTNWSKNFEGLCHSAVHSDSLGTGQSSSILAARIGLVCRPDHPFSTLMTRRDNLGKYMKDYQKKRQVKQKRFHGRMKRTYRRVRENSLYSSESDVARCHNYGQQDPYIT